MEENLIRGRWDCESGHATTKTRLDSLACALQVSDEQGAAEASPEVREPELPGVHAGEAVRAEAAHGDAEAATGGDGAQGGGGSRIPPHDAGADCTHTQQ